MQQTYGVILAAGRGSRMKGFTDEKPKCLLELAGKALLQWQMEAMYMANIEKILLMRGYKAEMLSNHALSWAQSFHVADNENWQNSNMLRTLLCANQHIKSAFAQGAMNIIVSYSDIVYTHRHIVELIKSTHDISITYDTLWKDLWHLRFDNPLSDAETFKQQNGMLYEIGKKTTRIEDIQGQYMGLLRFTHKGWQILCDTCAELGEKVDTTDMTTFLRILLNHGENIGTVPIQGKWCEADNQEDLKVYEKMLQQGNWPHDWR